MEIVSIHAIIHQSASTAFTAEIIHGFAFQWFCSGIALTTPTGVGSAVFAFDATILPLDMLFRIPNPMVSRVFLAFVAKSVFVIRSVHRLLYKGRNAIRPADLISWEKFSTPEAAAVDPPPPRPIVFHECHNVTPAGIRISY